MAHLKIGDLEVKGTALEISREPIWSKNTGRTSKGTMKGDIVCNKYKLSLTLPPMNDSETAEFDKAIQPAFFDVTFRNPSTGKSVTKKMYASSPKYPVYSYVNNLPRYVGIGVDFVEQ